MVRRALAHRSEINFYAPVGTEFVHEWPLLQKSNLEELKKIARVSRPESKTSLMITIRDDYCDLRCPITSWCVGKANIPAAAVS